MKTIWLLVIVCVIHITKACDGDDDNQAEFRADQQIDPYEFVNPFVVPYYYGRQSSRVPASGKP